MRTIAYGDHPGQVADLYLPDGDGPHPVVVLVHGGFWCQQYRRDLMAPLAEDLVARGYAVWNIEYRRVGGAGGYPETLADAAALLPTGVATLAVHGRADATVPIRRSEAYVAAATEAGDDAELAAVEGDHFTVITSGTAAWRTVLEALDAVLRADAPAR